MGINLIMSFIGVFIGGIITWYVARKYYIRASDDLRQESLNLRVLSNNPKGRVPRACPWVNE